MKKGFLIELWPFLKKQKGLMTLVFFLVFVFVGSMVIVPIFMGQAIDASLGGVIEDGEIAQLKQRFYLFLGLMAVFTLVSAVSQYFFEWLSSLLAQTAIKSLRDQTFGKLTYLPLKYIDNRPLGDLLSLASVDTENVMTGITALLRQFLEGVLTLLFTIALMYWLNWLLATVVLLLTPLSFFSARTVARYARSYFKKQTELAGTLSGLALERIKNYRMVKVLGMNLVSLKEFEDLNGQLYQAGQKAQFASSWTNPSTRFVNNLVYAVIGVVGAIMTVYGQQLAPWGAALSVGALSTFLVYALKFAKPFNDISSVATEVQNAKASLKRIQNVLTLPDERQDNADIIYKEVGGQIETIEFKDLKFGYEKNKPILQGLNLNVYAGHKIALVGPTGCGKTTLINLLLRFYDPDAGQILLGGKNSAQLPRRKVRRSFGMVLQDTWIFKGTIRANIAYANPHATLAEVKQAASKAQAAAFIERLPNKYDTIVSSSLGLSEGERQLLSIARVLLAKPHMVILDEATSSLDPLSEKHITAAIGELSQNKTTLVIAHRLQTIVSADAIAVIDHGRIGELGTHAELMAKKGFYYRMYTSQYQ